jgi:hypothetical protein
VNEIRRRLRITVKRSIPVIITVLIVLFHQILLPKFFVGSDGHQEKLLASVELRRHLLHKNSYNNNSSVPGLEFIKQVSKEAAILSHRDHSAKLSTHI